MEAEYPVIDPVIDYCSICGDEVDTSALDFVVDIPLCKSCWIEERHNID